MVWKKISRHKIMRHAYAISESISSKFAKFGENFRIRPTCESSVQPFKMIAYIIVAIIEKIFPGNYAYLSKCFWHTVCF
jgi:hypothetical protein